MRPPALKTEYIEARRALLDALGALQPQRKAVVIVGAQAVYLRAGGGNLAVSEYTTDGDLAIDPTLLVDAPTLGELMKEGGFDLARYGGSPEPGIWKHTAPSEGVDEPITVDLIVPEGIAPPGGTRGARLKSHGKRVARKTAGRAHRLNDKDASDVLRLMLASKPTAVAATLADLAEHQMAGPATAFAIDRFQELFGKRAGMGVELAIRALRQAMPGGRVRAICLAYAASLQKELQTPR